MRDGSRPDIIETRGGAQSGQGQYAFSKTVPRAANLSMFGFLRTDLPQDNLEYDSARSLADVREMVDAEDGQQVALGVRLWAALADRFRAQLDVLPTGAPRCGPGDHSMKAGTRSPSGNEPSDGTVSRRARSPLQKRTISPRSIGDASTRALKSGVLTTRQSARGHSAIRARVSERPA